MFGTLLYAIHLLSWNGFHQVWSYSSRVNYIAQMQNALLYTAQTEFAVIVENSHRQVCYLSLKKKRGTASVRPRKVCRQNKEKPSKTMNVAQIPKIFHRLYFKILRIKKMCLSYLQCQSSVTGVVEWQYLCSIYVTCNEIFISQQRQLFTSGYSQVTSESFWYKL